MESDDTYDYGEEEFTSALNGFGAIGWEIIHMEPEWHYTKNTFTKEMEQFGVSGWYVTFKRPVR